MHLVWDVFQNTVVITAFVAMMMVAIEYLNVITRGNVVDRMLNRRSKGYVIGVLLGMTPGCLGAFAMVSLYAHKRVSIGAIVATMVATSGDEAFVMLGLFPKTAVLMFVGLALLGMGAGWVTDKLVFKHHESNRQLDCAFETHAGHEVEKFEWRTFVNNWRSPSATRSILTVSIGLCIALMVAFKMGWFVPVNDHTGHVQKSESHELNHSSHHEHEGDKHPDETSSMHDHNHGTGGWTWYTLVGLLLFGIFVVATVSEHFLEEHLWGHVLKVHVPRMFLWTLGALAFIVVLDQFVDVANLVQRNLWLVLLVAVAVGFIPESGPHLVFVSLFASGAIPLSILVASSIVQDGHGMVPLLAHSRKDFFLVKLMNGLIGIVVGSAMLIIGW
ncbi:MAG: arsenic efflux protein [Deltaproteobacteria bacterium]|nr:arsenic efflux protein [Deltaproteobacteria bacterium]MBN2673176.1 arsenic efflux protein [Deltaproteobacteria bacterium]